MSAKYIQNVLVLLLVLILLVGSFLLGKHYKKPVLENTINNTTHTTLPVQTKIIRENVPAVIETLYINDTEYEIARYSAIIDTNKVNIKLDIKYDELLNLFDVSHQISTVRDSVYVEKITYFKENPKFIKFAAGMSSGFKVDDWSLDNVGVNAGIIVKQKYILDAFINTNKVIGIRLGVIF